MTGFELVRRLREDAAGQAVLDARGLALVAGSRIAPWEDQPAGVVVSVSDAEGDVDDEGRSVAINPRVTVRFDDGGEDEFPTSCEDPGYYGTAVFMAEDLERVSCLSPAARSEFDARVYEAMAKPCPPLGRRARVLVGDSVYEDATLTWRKGHLYVEFDDDEVADVTIPIEGVSDGGCR